MDYPVKPNQAERDDDLLNMLSENKLAVAARPTPPSIYLRQAFMTAAEAFESIDANTRGVVVPYADEGRAIISDLCSARELKTQFALLKRAQRFTVNVFPHVLEKLQDARAVNEAQEGTGILYLDERYYSKQFGLNLGGTEEMEFKNA
jgi:CRISPR-associated endonuclease/helicase Cas3